MLIRFGEAWVDTAMLEFVAGLDPDETGAGGITHYHGQPGFIRFDTLEGKPVLINAVFVAEVRPQGPGGSEVTTARGNKLLIKGSPGWVAGLVNGARRHVA